MDGHRPGRASLREVKGPAFAVAGQGAEVTGSIMAGLAGPAGTYETD